MLKNPCLQAISSEIPPDYVLGHYDDLQFVFLIHLKPLLKACSMALIDTLFLNLTSTEVVQ